MSSARRSKIHPRTRCGAATHSLTLDDQHKRGPQLCNSNIVLTLSVSLKSYDILIYLLFWQANVFLLIAGSLWFYCFIVKEFVEKEGDGLDTSLMRRRELGFTFSFRVKQTSVSTGILIKWTKGFGIEDMVSWIIFL